jgi:hypothetical protein
MRKSLRANTVRTVVRATGRVPGSVELVRKGRPDRHVSVTIGDVVCSIRDADTAEAIRDGWESAEQLAGALPFGVTPDRRDRSGLYEVLTVLSLSERPVVIAAMVGRFAEPAHLQVQVGPIFWQITDRDAYDDILSLWRRAYDLLASK